MLTVREMCKYFLLPKEIVVTMDGRNYNLLEEGTAGIDPIMIDFFGDFIVEDVQACEEDCFAIDVKMKPMKKEAIA